MRKDKQKVLDEVWDDDRVRGFLTKSVPVQSGQPLPGDADFYVLRHAYQSMRPDDFERFLDYFTAAGFGTSKPAMVGAEHSPTPSLATPTRRRSSSC